MAHMKDIKNQAKKAKARTGPKTLRLGSDYEKK
jgi:hypothetical protein